MSSSTTTQEPALYPGEVLDTIADYPTMYHYQPASNPPSSTPNPLIVCISGSMHLGRIFYGGHQTSNTKDFLSHHLSQLGYNTLSLSYPIESSPPILPATGSDFRIPTWGLQAALTTKKVLDSNNLPSRSVVLISWSMAGRMVTPFTISATELGLHVQQYISLAATPGISNIRALPLGMACTSAGYLSATSRRESFYSQLREMERLNGGREIIPKEVYFREYLGATPVNLTGMGLKYDGLRAFLPDDVAHEQETRVFDVANLPFISGLYPTSILDGSHALGDRATWGFLLTYVLERMIGKEGLGNVRGTGRWEKLLEFVHSAPGRLCVPVTGNHFFFVGEKSARETAEKVVALLDDGVEFQRELRSLME